jgi:hypothetical protein
MVDLGYANICEKKSRCSQAIVCQKKVADGPNIGQFFDYTAIKKINSIKQSLDSLLQLTTLRTLENQYRTTNKNCEYLKVFLFLQEAG